MHPLLQQTHATLAEELRGLDLAATQAHPHDEPASWSIQQVIEHLLATYTTCTASLEARLAKGRRLESPVSLIARLSRWTVIDIGYFPPGRKAPKAVLPGVVALEPLDGAGLDETVRVLLTNLDQALDRVAGVYPSQPVSTHVVLGPLTVQQWRKFHRIHAQHHAKQLKRIKNAIPVA